MINSGEEKPKLVLPYLANDSGELSYCGSELARISTLKVSRTYRPTPPPPIPSLST